MMNVFEDLLRDVPGVGQTSAPRDVCTLIAVITLFMTTTHENNAGNGLFINMSDRQGGEK